MAEINWKRRAELAEYKAARLTSDVALLKADLANELAKNDELRRLLNEARGSR